MSIFEKVKELYGELPFKVTLVNRKTAKIAADIFKYAVDNRIFEDGEDFAYSNVNKIEKYLVYYDIGKTRNIRAILGGDELEDAQIREARIKYLHYGVFILDKLYDDAEKAGSLTKEDSLLYSIVMPAVRDHEERCDGSGYPAGKKAEDITPLGKIAAVAEFIAVSILKGISEKNLTEDLLRMSGVEFDTAVVKGALSVLGNAYYRDDVRALLKLSEDEEDERAIELVYQPMYDSFKDETSFFESIACLKNEKVGILMPEVYVPVAERNGRMTDITKVAFEELCEKMASARYGKLPVLNDRIRYSFNVTASCLIKTSFLQFVKKTVEKYYVDPTNIYFEINETDLGVNEIEIALALKKFKDIGVGFIIDHFGAEYSSLSRLSELEVDMIKLDKSFSQKLNLGTKTVEIVRSMVQMAKNLNIGVIADGVNTTEQKEKLIELTCRYMQGDFIGKAE